MARSPKHDPQEQRAYAWENSFTKAAKPAYTPAEMRAAVERACRSYRVPAPQVHCVKRDKRNGKLLTSYSQADCRLIQIRPRHMTLDVALHEAAHFICDWILGWDLEIHGPQWLGIYMNLLVRFRVMPVSALIVTAKEKGLQWTPLWRVSPRHIRCMNRARVREARLNH